MGQGQEGHARKMIMDAMAGGGWVLLQNVHLSLPFCSEIIDILVETEFVEETFRMWVTTEPHADFPIGLLQMAIKFTNEPPQGIRASLKRSYQVLTEIVLIEIVIKPSLMNSKQSLFFNIGFYAGFLGLYFGTTMATSSLYGGLFTYNCTGKT